jgi:hypothetical protein
VRRRNPPARSRFRRGLILAQGLAKVVHRVVGDRSFAAFDFRFAILEAGTKIKRLLRIKIPKSLDTRVFDQSRSAI